MCQSNHTNQRAVVDLGGMELLAQLLQQMTMPDPQLGGSGLDQALHYPAALDAVRACVCVCVHACVCVHCMCGACLCVRTLGWWRGQCVCVCVCTVGLVEGIACVDSRSWLLSEGFVT